MALRLWWPDGTEIRPEWASQRELVEETFETITFRGVLGEHTVRLGPDGVQMEEPDLAWATLPPTPENRIVLEPEVFDAFVARLEEPARQLDAVRDALAAAGFVTSKAPRTPGADVSAE